MCTLKHTLDYFAAVETIFISTYSSVVLYMCARVVGYPINMCTQKTVAVILDMDILVCVGSICRATEGLDTSTGGSQH